MTPPPRDSADDIPILLVTILGGAAVGMVIGIPLAFLAAILFLGAARMEATVGALLGACLGSLLGSLIGFVVGMVWIIVEQNKRADTHL